MTRRSGRRNSSSTAIAELSSTGGTRVRQICTRDSCVDCRSLRSAEGRSEGSQKLAAVQNAEFIVGDLADPKLPLRMFDAAREALTADPARRRVQHAVIHEE